MIGSGIFQFTQAQIYVFVLMAFVYYYVYLAFTSLVIVVELCTFNFTVLHSITLFCTDLGLIDMLLNNQNAEIFNYCCMCIINSDLKSKYY